MITSGLVSVAISFLYEMSHTVEEDRCRLTSMANKCRIMLTVKKLGIYACYTVISFAVWKLEPVQSHYRQVTRWEIFMEQELRIGLDLGLLALLKKTHLGQL